MRDAGIVTISSTQPLDQVLRRVVGEIEAHDGEIFAVVDHTGEAADVGFEMSETKLILFGSARIATPVMLSHPLVALDLPLKLLIWSGNDGGVFLSYNSPEYLAERYGLSSAETDVLRTVVEVAADATA
jgi:uncharacterized protein (DUF302 family)